MLYIATALLALLPLLTVGQLLKADAKCVSGYDWMYTSVSQSPCDVAAELGSVCAGGQYNLPPLAAGYVYPGPTAGAATPCRCSSVYYSLLSACAYCQGRNYIRWSEYNGNCSTVYSQTYPEIIPTGVKVPAWAYQNVKDSDHFNVTVAQNLKGVESSQVASATAKK